MSNLRLHLPEPRRAVPEAPYQPLGRYLVQHGAMDQADLVHALNLQRHVDAPLGEILISEGLIARPDLLRALSAQYKAQLVDLDADAPVAGLAARLPASLCLKYHAVPWMEFGGAMLVATSRPDHFASFQACMGRDGRNLLPVIAEDAQVRRHISRLYGAELAQKAAARVPAVESCRSWDINPLRRRAWGGAVLAVAALLLVAAPLWTLTIAMLWALATLCMTTALKAAALWSQLSQRVLEQTGRSALDATPFRLPRVSILVPLLREKEIAGALITRLSRLTYPKSLLDIVLVLEAEDHVTRDTLARTALPDWISVIEVPAANRLTTKPRALNYALDFCRGSIVGVWDAEDAPEPDQIERVVTRFRDAPDNVACLQGVLDYYNSRTNWLSRCFTIEYASWWRIVLPGIARLGLVVPLGGTTLFFRRDVLEKLCGWDAHNVTEDADLGVRLARHGYVTELLPTITYEEANCRPCPWVRQRSRWLKGFLITWCVHMRHPGTLLRDLGFLRFMGVQTLFLATFSQFACAPLLWSFWLTLAGVAHPVEKTLGHGPLLAMVGVFVAAECLNLAVALIAVSGREHRHLMAWTVTLPVYFMLGTLAAFKALQEFVVRPFYWDKTAHGVSGPPGDAGK